MIIKKCDICNKEAKELETIVLYKNKFDHCKNCEKEANKIIESFRREIAYEAVIIDSRLKSKERDILKKLKARNYKGIVVKGGTNE